MEESRNGNMQKKEGQGRARLEGRQSAEAEATLSFVLI